MSISQQTPADDFECDAPTYANYLAAAAIGASHLRYASDTKQGFTRTKVAEVWCDRLETARRLQEAYSAFQEAWDTDCYASGAEEFESGYQKLIDTTIHFEK